MLDIDRSTYAYYETGRAEPSLGVLKILSAIYHVSTDFLLDNSDEDN
ncbi:MAG: helix-turn-helix domain-containing protein [[Clostridium] leptum]